MGELGEGRQRGRGVGGLQRRGEGQVVQGRQVLVAIQRVLCHGVSACVNKKGGGVNKRPSGVIKRPKRQ